MSSHYSYKYDGWHVHLTMLLIGDINWNWYRYCINGQAVPLPKSGNKPCRICIWRYAKCTVLQWVLLTISADINYSHLIGTLQGAISFDFFFWFQNKMFQEFSILIRRPALEVMDILKRLNYNYPLTRFLLCILVIIHVYQW